MNPTVPLPAPSRGGALFIGTIGFDLYVALFATHAALKSSPPPADLGKLLAVKA